MSDYDSADGYGRPRRRHVQGRSRLYESQDGGASSDPHEYQQSSPRQRKGGGRRSHRPSSNRSTQSSSSRRRRAPRRGPPPAWQQQDEMDGGEYDDVEFMGFPFLPFPFPPHLAPPGVEFEPDELDPYGYDDEEEAMLQLDEMSRFGRLPPPLPPPPHHPFFGPHPMMMPPPLLRPFMAPEECLDDDGEPGLSDDELEAPPFLGEHVPPPGFLPPLPHLGPPPPPFADQVMRPKRSHSLPARKARLPATELPGLPPLLLRRNSSSARRQRRKHRPSASLRRVSSVTSSPGARRTAPQHEPSPHSRSAPGSPVELRSPAMGPFEADQFHDALSHQGDDDDDDDSESEWQHQNHPQQQQQQQRSRPPPMRRRSVHVVPSMAGAPPPPIPMLGRRHSVYEPLGSDMHMPPSGAPHPSMAMGDTGPHSSSSSAPGTPWMPASYFSSPAMPPAPHPQPPPMMQAAPPQGIGMMPSSTFGPAPMNPFMMSPFGRPPPPMRMMHMMGGPGMLDDGDGFPGGNSMLGPMGPDGLGGGPPMGMHGMRAGALDSMGSMGGLDPMGPGGGGPPPLGMHGAGGGMGRMDSMGPGGGGGPPLGMHSAGGGGGGFGRMDTMGMHGGHGGAPGGGGFGGMDTMGMHGGHGGAPGGGFGGMDSMGMHGGFAGAPGGGFGGMDSMGMHGARGGAPGGGFGGMDSMGHAGGGGGQHRMGDPGGFDVGGHDDMAPMGRHHSGGGSRGMPSSSGAMMGSSNAGGRSSMPPHSHPMMMGGSGRQPMRRKSWLGGLFGANGGGKATMDRSMWDRSNMVPLEDALGNMSIGGHGAGSGAFASPDSGSPSSMRSVGSGLSRSSSKKISNKAQQLQRFPGIWCYRPRHMTMLQGDDDGSGGNVWAPFSVSNQHKLHRMIDMGGGHMPSNMISLDKEDKLSGTIYLSPRSMVAYRYRSLLSSNPELLDIQYLPTHDSQFVVRPEHDSSTAAGDLASPRPGANRAAGPGGAGSGPTSRLFSSVFSS